MFTVRLTTGYRPRVIALGLATLLIAGCGAAPPANPSAAELEWARAALARNPSLEVMSVDPSARLIRVRDKTTGSVRSVRLDELAAMPLPDGAAGAATAATGPAVTQPGLTQSAAPAASSSGAPGGAGSASTVTAPANAAGGADARAQPGESASNRDEEVVHATPAVRTRPPGTVTAAGTDYAIERNQGVVTITGPGVSITSRPQPEIVTTSTGALAPAEGTERLSEPLRCQGGKFLRLDNQRLAFAGDGIVVERGCELYLTNSHIEALGTALVADASTVHLTNTTIIGGTSSLKMQNGAEVYVGGSTLKGISRRFDSSQLHDLGGNRWD